MVKENPSICNDISRNNFQQEFSSISEAEKQQIYEHTAEQCAAEILEKHIEAFRELAK